MYQIAVSLIPTSVWNIRSMLDNLGSAEAVFKKENIQELPDLAPDAKKALLNGSLLSMAERELKNMREHRIRGRFVLDEDYPYRLRECSDAPIMLYSRGIHDLSALKMVAVVGTRKATPLGKESTQMLLKDLARHFPDLVVVSGLAYGIDVIAHQAALQNGLKTIAVLAHGLQEIYPTSHRWIANDLYEDGGALLSEYPFGTPSIPHHFLERNRIIAGLCDCCIVMESAIGGGSMSTAKHAREYNRDILAFPGRSVDKYSSGCNELIKQRTAALVETAEDVIRELNWVSPIKRKSRQQTLFAEIPAEQKALMKLLGIGELQTVNDLSIRSGLRIQDVLLHLLELEMAGMIECLPGGSYRRKGPQ